MTEHNADYACAVCGKPLKERPRTGYVKPMQFARPHKDIRTGEARCRGTGWPMARVKKEAH